MALQGGGGQGVAPAGCGGDPWAARPVFGAWRTQGPRLFSNPFPLLPWPEPPSQATR
jgi:hypothetical protein